MATQVNRIAHRDDGEHLDTGGGSGFDPSLGLQRLRELIASIGRDEGIEVTGDIGVTSHTGDLLRRAVIPSRLAAPPQGRR